jgi:hypothetical protein
MNEPAENRLGCTRTPEPDIRLRKGHQLDGTRGGGNDNHQGDSEPGLEASISSFHPKKVSESWQDSKQSQNLGDNINKKAVCLSIYLSIITIAGEKIGMLICIFYSE